MGREQEAEEREEGRAGMTDASPEEEHAHFSTIVLILEEGKRTCIKRRGGQFF
jgi:hypothetical protein